jgi:hypothetical protein
MSKAINIIAAWLERYAVSDDGTETRSSLWARIHALNDRVAELEAALRDTVELADRLNEFSWSGAGPLVSEYADKEHGLTWGSRVLQAVEPARAALERK